jgi:hypothetical protein
MKFEYEWHAVDERGRVEEITSASNRARQRKPRPWWCWALLGLLVGVAGAALAYSGYVAFS